MKLKVPYHSQYIEIENPFWNIRGCGSACFKMVTDFHEILTPSLLELCEEAKEKGGYDINNGWVHDYIVEKAKQLGLNAYREEGLHDTTNLKAVLDKGNPVIVSVEKKVLEQSRFHMIVLVGYEDGSFIYNEPEATVKEKGIERRCTEEIFMNYWRGKAIFISK